MENVRTQVVNILLNVRKDVEPHIEGTNLISGGILDSLDIMNLIMALEDEFDIEIDVDELVPDNFNTIEAMKQLIEKLQNEL